MGFNFPDSPIVGQVFPPFQWDGEKWFMQAKPGKGEALVTVSDTPPIGPVDGQFWWNSATGVLFFRFNDGSSSQWVVAVPVPDITQITTKSYVDAGDAAAKTYTDAGDAASKAYTDAGNAAAKAYTDAGDATLNTLIGSVVRYTPQALTSPQQAQARANINAAPTALKNYVLNGAMMVSAENGATAGTVTGYYPVDMWWAEIGGGGAFSIAQVASPTPGGSPNRIRVTVTTAAAVAVTDYGAIVQFVEGLRCFDLRFGNIAAKTITIRFGVRAPAGTYSVVVGNGSINRTYVSEFVIAAGEANTDVLRYVTVPGDQVGTWATDNTRCLYLRWSLRTGTNYQQATNFWGTNNAVGSPNQFNLFGTVNNVYELFDVALYEGTVVPAYVVPDVVLEKWLCRRYFQYQTSSSAMWLHPIDNGGTQYRRRWYEFQPEMRIAPVLTILGGNTGTPAGPITANQITPLNCELWGDATPNTAYTYFTSLKANARL